MTGYGAGIRAALAGLVALMCAGTVRPVTPAIAARPQRARTEPEAPLDTPDTIISSGVAQYVINAPKLFWHEVINVLCDPDAHTKEARDVIRRVAVQGSTKRTLYDHTFQGSSCASEVISNIVADDDFVYWSSPTGVLKLPTDAVTQTVPTTLSAVGANSTGLVLTTDAVYALTPSSGIRKILKATGAASTFVSAGSVGASPSNFQSDGAFLYWVSGGLLKRQQISGGSVTQIGGSGVTAYKPIFHLCLFGSCSDSTPNGVFVATGHVIKRYNILDGALIGTVYTSSDTQAVVRQIGVQNSKLVAMEDREVGPGNPFIPIATFIVTKGSDGSGSNTLIYASSSTSISTGPGKMLQLYDDRLYWLEDGVIKRLSTGASAVPQTNMRITSMEVTQGIQNLSNSVRLISGKRTIVRMHVKSDGPPVDGVTALLYRLDALLQPVGAPLIPSNKTSEYITVSSNPKRVNLDQSFWFELPSSWVNTGFLYLKGELNPYHYPPQASYANNTSISMLTISPSPRLEMNFVLFDYNYDGTNYSADYFDDYLPTLSWLHRAYPISSRQDYIQNPGDGLHTHYFYVHDQQLRKHLDYTSSDCPDSPSDDGGLCASDYINSYLEDIDDEDNNDAAYYGFMPSFTDKYGNNWFARGQADGDTANGPSDTPGSKSWDTDGTIADWYGAHEMGHQLGRDHPEPAGDPDTSDSVRVGCGHSDDDGSFPYPGARIGTGSLMGFDVGDPGVHPNLIMQPLDNVTWKDLMSYCDNQWISDYTYEAIYDELGPAAAKSSAPASPQQSIAAEAQADILRVKGSILPGPQAVKFIKVQHKQGVVSAPQSGAFELRLRDAANALLHTTVFTPSIGADAGDVPRFDLSVAWMPGARKIDIVHTPSNTLYGSYQISPNAPVVSNVRLLAPTSPLTGSAQLDWQVSDPDGGALKFDVYYSRDNGAHFVPVVLNISDPVVTINSLLLGGSTTALFKVKASDGVNSASANSPVFAVANKPPKVVITSPANGTTYNYGQVINFSAIAEDLQTGGIADGSLTWRNQYQVLGTGQQLSVADLQTGPNYITLTAQSTTGLQTSASIVVTVTDDLEIAGPTLSAAPATIGWHFEPGSTASQTATLFIDNIGTGTVNWQLANAAPWLSTSAITGTAPSTITLTADPAALGNVPGAKTPLVITFGSQQQTVWVNATIGNAFDPYDLPLQASPDRVKVFLPLVARSS